MKTMDMTKWRVGASAVLIVHLSAPPVFAQDPGAGAPGEAERVARQLIEAQEAARQASAKQKEAEGKAADAETAKKNQLEVDAARRAAEAKRVIKYGVTVGAAASVQIPLPSWNTLDEPAAATMPYVVLLPFFWGQNATRNAYCAAEWSGPEENALAAAALAGGKPPSSLTGARRILQERYDEQELLNEAAEAAALELREAKKTLIEKCPEAKNLGLEITEISSVKASLDAQCASSAFFVNRFVAARNRHEQVKRELVSANNAVATAEYNVKDLSCWGHKFGLYVGYPVTFNATTDIKRGTAKNVSNRDVSPVISMGLALVPNAVVTILAGATLATAPRDDGTSAVVGSFTFGLGANADLVNVIP
ncbi:hypothetical protein [Sorangium sp. So ce1182]|uniref:hypothetical protein n=1 Tax=Sorangium sp. So ce1182 TaxID=3133334 RepID=UPI003F6374D1